MKKRLLAILLTVCMVISMAPAAFAADGIDTEAELIDAVQASGTVTLTGDIDLTNVLVIGEDKEIVLNLGEYNIIQTAYDKNAINNAGTLTINGTGAITGTWNGIYNTGTITVNGGTITGYWQGLYNGDCWDEYDEDGEYVTTHSSPGTAIINDGTFGAEDWVGIINYDQLTFNAGSFTTEYAIDNYGTATVAANTYIGLNFYDCTYADGVVFENSYVTGTFGTATLKNSTLGRTVTGGTFTLEDATLNATVYNGSFTGTVSHVGKELKICGGTFADETKASIETAGGSCASGYTFKDQNNGAFTVEKAASYTFQVTSANTNMGTLGYASYQYSSGIASNIGGGFTVNPYDGSVVKFSIVATPAENYEFKGWYTNAAGNGSALSTEANLTNYEYTVTGNTTIYAVFVESDELAAFLQATNDWLGDYDNTESFTVNSKEEMAYFAYAVNELGYSFSGKTVTLTTNLVYVEGEDYTPVGTVSQAFAGTFDGGEKTISGLNLSGNYIGVFGKSTGTIKNLNVADSVLTGFGYHDYVGGIVGEASGTVLNCHATNVEVSGWFAGCIVGHTFGMKIEDVSVTGSKASGPKGGGIVGYANDLILTDATVSDLKLSNAAGAVGGNVHNGVNVLTDIVVSKIESTDNTVVSLLCTTYGAAGTITITGNKTSVDVDSIIGGSKDETITVITGGSYSTESVLEYCKEGYKLQENNDGTFGVTEVTLEEKENQAEITIVVSPADAVIELKQGGVTVGSVAGTHSLYGGTYTYTVSRSGYVTQTGSFTVDGEAKTISITLTQLSAEPVVTVTYTDGVPGREIFPDQVYENLLIGMDTPVFNPMNYGYQGYAFDGWTPAVSETVTGSVTYTATWRQTHFQFDTPVKPGKPAGTPDVPATPIVPETPHDCLVEKFADLNEDAWYHNAVDYVLETGLMRGVSTTESLFDPYGTTSRAMIVTILYRMEGEPVVTGENPFSDVADDEWYTDAVLWAAENEIVLGYDGAFFPTDDVTAEQLMLILQRYAEYKGWTVDDAVAAMIAPYDYNAWADNGVIWAHLNGVLNIGTEITDLTAPATRAELAGYLYQFAAVAAN